MNYQEWLATVEANKHFGLNNIMTVPSQIIVDVAIKTTIDLVAHILESDVEKSEWEKHYMTYTKVVGDKKCHCAIGGLMSENELDIVVNENINGNVFNDILPFVTDTYISVNVFLLLGKLQAFNDKIVSSLNEKSNINEFLHKSIADLNSFLKKENIEYVDTNIKQYLDNVVFAHQPKNEEQK